MKSEEKERRKHKEKIKSDEDPQINTESFQRV